MPTIAGNIGTIGDFTGNVSVGGTLTYEDVTNVDSVGIVTSWYGSSHYLCFCILVVFVLLVLQMRHHSLVMIPHRSLVGPRGHLIYGGG